VTLELGGETLAVLELDLLTTGALLQRIAGSGELPVTPLSLTRIEEAALGWVCLSALSALRRELALAEFSPRLVSLTLDRGEVLQQLDARRRHVAVLLEFGVGETRGASRLLLPAQWLQGRLQMLPEEPEPAPLPEVLAAGVPARCFAGWALLSPGDAAALAPGDVVLFAGFSRGTSGLLGPGRLVGPTFELRGTFSDAGFTLTRATERPTLEHPMSAVDPTVPVEVEVELTRVRLPLDKLGTLRPGNVIPLHVNAAQQVVLRIGDRAVARAELVEIEGELGARLVSML
jgi:type III secretion protein Q